jgi:acylphosphatase
MSTRRRVIVSGRVQGVGFRAACRRAALDAHVAGWVRNLSDGRVEAVFEGDAVDVEQMLSWCRQGPTYAEVESVEVVEEAPRGETGFAAG